MMCTSSTLFDTVQFDLLFGELIWSVSQTSSLSKGFIFLVFEQTCKITIIVALFIMVIIRT